MTELDRDAVRARAERPYEQQTLREALDDRRTLLDAWEADLTALRAKVEDLRQMHKDLFTDSRTIIADLTIRLTECQDRWADAVRDADGLRTTLQERLRVEHKLNQQRGEMRQERDAALDKLRRIIMAAHEEGHGALSSVMLALEPTEKGLEAGDLVIRGSREEWGVVVDALIQHREHAEDRRAANPESTSDVRADMCVDLIQRINRLASTEEPRDWGIEGLTEQERTDFLNAITELHPEEPNQ